MIARPGEMQDALRATLRDAVGSCEAQVIALSGGLDSSIIAALRGGDGKTRCVNIVSSEFDSSDMAYSQTMAQSAGLGLDIANTSIDDIIDSINEIIPILGNYNTIEIRNSVVIHLALREVHRSGGRSVITGDGADELFAGYSFLVNAPHGLLREKLERLQRIMHFPSKRIAQSMGIRIDTPYLDERIVDIAREIPEDMLVSERDGVRIGKWILRKAFEDMIPENIAWRQKVPMAQGAGVDGIGGFLENVMPDSVFTQRSTEILDNDDVQIRSKESLHYYEIYRKHHGVPPRAKDGVQSCADCHSDTSANDGRFCRMCGKFPA